jgi:hypothetical protein
MLSCICQAIELDPPFLWGYEQKGALLHGAGRCANALDAYKTMVVTLQRSPHPHDRGTHIFEGLEACLLISPCRQSSPVRRFVKDGGGNSKGHQTNHPGYALCARRHV